MFYLTNIEEYGNNIYLFGYNNDIKEVRKIPYYNEIYIPTKDESKYKNIYGQTLKKKIFDNKKKYKEFIERRKNSDLPYYGEVDASLIFYYRYFKKNNSHTDIFKKLELKNEIMKKMRIFYYDIECAYKDSYVKFKDIEKSNAMINALSFFDTKTKTLCCLGLNDFGEESEKKMLETFKDDVKRVKYIKCEDEKQLLEKWCGFLKKANIDILVGYNSDGFDNPYIAYRMIQNDIDIKNLSPIKKARYWSKELLDKKGRLKKKEYNIKIYGIVTIDYWKLYKTLTYKNYSSNSLDSVAKREIGEGKIDYISESSSTDNIIYDLNDLAETDWETFVKYNMKDTVLMKMIDDKIGFIDNSWLLSMIANCEHHKIFSTIRMYDASIYSFLMNDNLVIDADRKSFARKYIGGYVKNDDTEGLIPGLYKWIVSFDIDSEYPTATINSNISPETLLYWTDENKLKYRELYEFWIDMIDKYNLPIKEITNIRYTNDNEKNVLKFMVYPNNDYKKFVSLLKNYDLTYTPNGKFYRRDIIGFLPRLFKHDFDFRLHLKGILEDKFEIQIKRLEQNIKIRLNSGYGYTGNQYSRYCNVDGIAESIVTFGRIEIQTVAYSISNYLYEKYGNLYKNNNIGLNDVIVYTDTDSNYINIQPVVEKIISENKDDYNNMEIHDFTKKHIVPFTDIELQGVINNCLRKLHHDSNGVIDYFGMKREVISDKAVFVGAKHYAMRKLFDGKKQCNEKNELKVNGLEIIKSTTPGKLREIMLKYIDYILDSDTEKLRIGMSDCKNKILNVFDVDDFAKVSSISVSMDEYTDKNGNHKKGTPQHIKASIIYNNFIEANKISLPEINTDDKIKLLYLKKPNPLGVNVDCIAYKNDYPKEKHFNDIKNYIDKSKMFDVLVNSSVNNILKKINVKFNIEIKRLF